MATPDHPFHAPGMRIPRFLFRGFNNYSGGGLSGQNTTEGIVPRGFLVGYDTEEEISSSMEPWRVKFRVEQHCWQQESPPTPFSSWSHDWRTALVFACARTCETSGGRDFLRADHGGHIAILDTWALGDKKTLGNKIFHVPRFGIPDLNFPCEWLIWGPISGPAYRCVPVSTIRETISCQKWPDHIPWKQSEGYLLDNDVHDSMLIAGCFQRSDDVDDDVMFAVAAAELGRRMWGPPYEIAPDRDLETDPVLPIWPRGVLEALLDVFDLCEPMLSDRPLVHGRTAVVGFPCVRLMYTLLLKTRARWGDTYSDAPWAPVDWKKILRKHFGWRRSSCGLCVKEGRL